jgi:hypothetical protein
MHLNNRQIKAGYLSAFFIGTIDHLNPIILNHLWVMNLELFYSYLAPSNHYRIIALAN